MNYEKIFTSENHSISNLTQMVRHGSSVLLAQMQGASFISPRYQLAIEHMMISNYTRILDRSLLKAPQYEH